VTKEAFGRILNIGTRCYLELGTYCGASARLAAKLAPNAEIYCVDVWDWEHMRKVAHQYEEKVAQQSLELAQSNLWPYRDRVTLVRGKTLPAMRMLADDGVQPEIIYIDADHHPRAVYDDISLAMTLWPKAFICGDDFDEVNAAITQAVDRGFKRNGKFWWLCPR